MIKVNSEVGPLYLLDACYYSLQDVDIGRGFESQRLGISSGDMSGEK
jgi:hypothetical protein